MKISLRCPFLLPFKMIVLSIHFNFHSFLCFPSCKYFQRYIHIWCIESCFHTRFVWENLSQRLELVVYHVTTEKDALSFHHTTLVSFLFITVVHWCHSIVDTIDMDKNVVYPFRVFLKYVIIYAKKNKALCFCAW